MERRDLTYLKFFSGTLSTSSGDALGIALCTSGLRTASTSATAHCIKFKLKFHHPTNKLDDLEVSRTSEAASPM